MGTQQASRFVWSTVVGEGLDSLIFTTIAFIGIWPTSEMVTVILTIWGVKVLYEIVALPFSMRVANWVKRVEGIDVIDDPKKIDYSPFSME